MQQAKSPVAKARLGASLATLDSRDGNDKDALAMLDASQGDDLPSDSVEQRLILRAGSVARQGDPAGAAMMLAPARTVQALETRAQILETAADWPGAEQAWSDVVAATVSDSGMLDEPQTRTVLRLATATARADDAAKLATLHDTYGPRIGVGPLGDMFRLLTAEPINTTADIKRSQREMSLAGVIAGRAEGSGVHPANALILSPGFCACSVCGFLAAGAKRGLAPTPPNHHVPPPWPQGTVGAFRAYSPTGRLLVGRGTR